MRVTARPMPLLAPVTTAILPTSLRSMAGSLRQPDADSIRWIVDVRASPGDRLEPLVGDGLTADLARPVGAGLELRQRPFHVSQQRAFTRGQPGPFADGDLVARAVGAIGG